MDSQQFRAAAHQMIDYVIDYLDNIRERYLHHRKFQSIEFYSFGFIVFRRVLPTVEPGYMRRLLPEEAPEHGESWQNIFQDVERVIMPGVY